jgi:hypothetical protein
MVKPPKRTLSERRAKADSPKAAAQPLRRIKYRGGVVIASDPLQHFKEGELDQAPGERFVEPETACRQLICPEHQTGKDNDRERGDGVGRIAQETRPPLVRFRGSERLEAGFDWR